MPPKAETTGRANRRRFDSSPRTVSNLMSRPTTKKKTVISPSRTQVAKSATWRKPPT
jgi:hypothetical protein